MTSISNSKLVLHNPSTYSLYSLSSSPPSVQSPILLLSPPPRMRLPRWVYWKFLLLVLILLEQLSSDNSPAPARLLPPTPHAQVQRSSNNNNVIIIIMTWHKSRMSTRCIGSPIIIVLVLSCFYYQLFVVLFYNDLNQVFFTVFSKTFSATVYLDAFQIIHTISCNCLAATGGTMHRRICFSKTHQSFDDFFLNNNIPRQYFFSNRWNCV